jgi:broad specificity phosphatase PhoE
MICKLFVFRHSETFDNRRGVFSGWRDSELTLKGFAQAQEIAEQLKKYRIDYAFTSHLRRARKTLDIVLQGRVSVPVFTDDRLIERCYGLLQGKDKRKMAQENPDWYAQIHRRYNFIPPEGESLSMVEKRVFSFLQQLRDWLRQAPGNVAISCHSNSIRPIRRVFEHLNMKQMLQLETSHNCILVYDFHQHDWQIESSRDRATTLDWKGIVIPGKVRLATDTLNPLGLYCGQPVSPTER